MPDPDRDATPSRRPQSTRHVADRALATRPPSIRACSRSAQFPHVISRVNPSLRRQSMRTTRGTTFRNATHMSDNCGTPQADGLLDRRGRRFGVELARRFGMGEPVRKFPRAVQQRLEKLTKLRFVGRSSSGVRNKDVAKQHGRRSFLAIRTECVQSRAAFRYQAWARLLGAEETGSRGQSGGNCSWMRGQAQGINCQRLPPFKCQG